MGHSIAQFFQSFQAKDWLTLTGTIVALLFSSLSYYQKRNETFWSTRRELSDTLRRIGELNVEVAKLRVAADQSSNYAGLLNDQRRYLVRQASELAHRIRSAVTTSEYLIIAWGFDAIDDVVNADVYFRKAIETPTEQYEHGLAMRSYARFLESNHENERSREYYDKAMLEFAGDNDRATFYRADTYTRRAEALRNRGATDDAAGLFAAARAEYAKLRNSENKERLIGKLKRIENPGAPII
jgi:tetratricopeptide (TPR) repeat protein